MPGHVPHSHCTRSSHPTNGRCSADVLAAAPLARPVTWDQSSKRGTASSVTFSIARAPLAGSVATTTRSELTEGGMSMVSAVLHDQEAPPTVDSSDAGEPSAAVSNRAVELAPVELSLLPQHLHMLVASTSIHLHTSSPTRPPLLSPALIYTDTPLLAAVSMFSFEASGLGCSGSGVVTLVAAELPPESRLLLDHVPSAATAKTARVCASVPMLTIIFLLRVATCAARPKCFLHVGPHKTGTTTLQTALYTHAYLLEQDGWHQPSRNQFSQENQGPKQFASVAFSIQKDEPNESAVWQSFEGWISARVRRNESIVLSSEELDRRSVQRSLLASVLAPFETTVVVGYRIFFDWILSLYREIGDRQHHIAGGVVVAADKNMPLSRWLTPSIISGYDSTFNDRYFTDDLMRAYARHFDDIRVLPLSSATVTTLVCAFMGAHRTCASLIKKPAEVRNVRARPPPLPAAPGLHAGICMSQGGCLDRQIRTMLLTRAYRGATEIASLPHSPPLVTNRTELDVQLDALGLCFC